MNKVHLVDGCFFPRARSATLAGDRLGEGPSFFEWANGPGDVTFYTDICLEQTVGQPGWKVAWLIEPPGDNRAHYETAQKLHDQFDYILTYNAQSNSMPNYLFYPKGGSWIKPEDWGLYPKNRDVSIILSDKHTMPGHQLRWQVYNEFQLDAFGWGVNPVDSKLEALADYRYSVVVESCRLNYYFSEKLIDCLSCGTVPIYWGCPGVGRFFDMDGIIPFETMDELDYVLLNVCSERDYRNRLKAIDDNLNRARTYACAEDWIYGHYTFLF